MMHGQKDSTRRRFLAASVSGLAGARYLIGAADAAGRDASPAPPKRGLRDSLFVMDCWFWRSKLTPKEQVELLAALGCRGMSWCLINEKLWAQFPEVLRLLDTNKLDLAAVYVPHDIRQTMPDRRLMDLIRSLKGRKTLIWLGLTSTKDRPSSRDGDGHAVKLVRQVADVAAAAGLGVSLYHHAGFWLERVGDAVRVAQLAERDNVGATLNLYHWLKVEGPGSMEPMMKVFVPHLSCVTINGSVSKASRVPVEQAILPLGEGNYDVGVFVKTLVRLGYTGPIGLQGYGISGDVRGKLKRSVRVWRTLADSIQSTGT